MRGFSDYNLTSSQTALQVHQLQHEIGESRGRFY